MKGKAADIPFGKPGRPCSIAEFTRDLMARMARHHPERAAVVRGVCDDLEGHFFAAHDRLPVCFCHGDPHPVIVLWGADGIRAVIDWEFSGLRPLVYDAALIIGCVGAEARGALDGAFLEAFRRRLGEREAFAPEFAKLLPLFTVAQRFAWLSEWLRRDDREMVEFECFYMNLLRRRKEEGLG
jgi:homoserine kinase type II